MWQELKTEIGKGNINALARSISLVENEVTGYEQFLASLISSNIPVIGITGPPGAGKSTITDALIRLITSSGKRVAVLCVDPSSPFNFGALLGDRIRMSEWYNDPKVFIRSLATRGALGGLHPKIIEITDLLMSASFDFIIVETVGVGQSEVEIAGLADVTIVTIVPEAGDEIQTMKAGLMEIADIFVVNKADRPGADAFVSNLRLMLAPVFSNHREIPIIKTTATTQSGIDTLYESIISHLKSDQRNDKRMYLLTEKAWQLLQHKRMKDIDKKALFEKIKQASTDKNFNLYRFIDAQ